MEENKNQMADMAVNYEPLDDLPFFDDEETAIEKTETEQMTETPTEDENVSLKADTATENEESDGETTDDSENENVSEEKAEESADTETENEDFISQPEQRILDEMNRRVSEDGDEQLAKAMESADKNIHDCYRYVEFCAKKEMEKIMKGKHSGGIMIDDPVVYGWAVHYYTESKETIDAEMKPKIKEIPKTAPKADTKTAKKGKKKANETPKPIKNVIDLSKIITAKKATEDGKKTKREKKKDSLSAGFVPMERPDCANYEKEAKKGSREQAKSVSQMDLFADFFSE